MGDIGSIHFATNRGNGYSQGECFSPSLLIFTYPHRLVCSGKGASLDHGKSLGVIKAVGDLGFWVLCRNGSLEYMHK